MANDHSLSLTHASSQYADVSTNTTNSLAQLTVMAWIKPTTLATNYGLVTNWPDSGTNTQFIFRENSANGDIIAYIATGLGDDATKNGVTGTGAISTGAWQHIAMVFNGTATGNGGRLNIYVNGTAQSLTYSGTIPGTLVAITGRVQVGARDDSTDFYDGLIDEVKLLGTALTGAQILSYYQCDSQPTALTYWAMNNNLNDSSGNNLTLTGHASPTFSTDVPFSSYSCPGGGAMQTGKFWGQPI